MIPNYHFVHIQTEKLTVFLIHYRYYIISEFEQIV